MIADTSFAIVMPASVSPSTATRTGANLRCARMSLPFPVMWRSDVVACLRGPLPWSLAAPGCQCADPHEVGNDGTRLAPGGG